MKKLFIILLFLLVLTTTSFAQVYLGGSLGFSKHGDEKAFSITPEIGYCLTERSSVSMEVGYSVLREHPKYPAEHSLYVAPCYTYAIPIDEAWTFDINGALGYSREFSIDNNVLGVYIGPQIEYMLTPNWSLWGAFDMLSVECDWNDSEKPMMSYHFDWFKTGIDFGFYYYF